MQSFKRLGIAIAALCIPLAPQLCSSKPESNNTAVSTDVQKGMPAKTGTAKGSSNLIVNGSFEQSPDSGSGWINYATGSTAIPGWVVSKGDIDLWGGIATPYGKKTIDLNGQSAGAVMQTIQTEPGSTYRIKFYAGSYDSLSKSVYLRVAGNKQVWPINLSGTNENPQLRAMTFDFKAREKKTTVEIGSATEGTQGPVLDNVSCEKIADVQSAAEPIKPGAAATQPAPVAESTPSIPSAKPPVAESAPSVPSMKPPVAESTPSIPSAKPPVAESAPSIPSAKPPVAESASSVPNTKPPVVESTPSVPSTKPPVTESTPSIPSAKPPVAESAPTIPSTKPPVAESTPSIPSAKPPVAASTPSLPSTKPPVEQTKNAASTTAGASVDKKPRESLLDLVQSKNDYKVGWANLFKGEWSIPTWIQNLDAVSTAVSETNNGGKDFVFGSMAKASDPTNDRVIVLFSADHKKAWGLEITVPAGLGADAVAHPKKYASLQFFGAPDQSMKKNLMGQLEKDPTWK